VVSLEVSNEFELVAGQSAPAPFDRRNNRWRIAVGVDQLWIEQELIVIAHDARATEFCENLDNRVRFRSHVSNIAETDHLIDASSPDVAEDRPERQLVRVYVGDQGNSGHSMNRFCR
jgi:hypothetical protein